MALTLDARWAGPVPAWRGRGGRAAPSGVLRFGWASGQAHLLYSPDPVLTADLGQVWGRAPPSHSLWRLTFMVGERQES